ncbi:MAG: AAA family ATPase [Acidobacteriota bacterium]
MSRKFHELSISDKYHPFLENLSEQAENSERIPFVGREEELEAVMETLLRKLKSNLLLVGKPGVGKTALITELAARINSGKVHPSLKGKVIFELSMNRFFFKGESGDNLVSEFEGLFGELISNRDKIILFLNEMEIGSIAGIEEKKNSSGIQNLLKSYFINRELKLIGATTPDYYYRFMKSDDFLSMNFSTVFLEEPDQNVVLDILSGISPYFENYYSIKIKKKILSKIFELSKRFVPHRNFPGKGVELLDSSCSKASVKGEKELKIGHIYKSLSDITKLPPEIIKLDPVKHASGILSYLKKRIVNQSLALEEVARIIKLSRFEADKAGSRAEGVFLFLGPPGVGKSYIAREIAEYLFGSREKLRAIDLSEYKSPEDVEKLISGPDGEMGELIREFELHPFSVIYFENIDKTHTSTLEFLRDVLDKGEVLDSSGKKYCVSNKIFVFSLTRIGDEVSKSQIGFVKGNKMLSRIVIPSKIINVLDWVDEIIEFSPLGKESLEKIAVNEMEEIADEIGDKFFKTLVFDKKISKILSAEAEKRGGSAHIIVEFVEREIRSVVIDYVTGKNIRSDKLYIKFKNNRIEISESGNK